VVEANQDYTTEGLGSNRSRILEKGAEPRGSGAGRLFGRLGSINEGPQKPVQYVELVQIFCVLLYNLVGRCRAGTEFY